MRTTSRAPIALLLVGLLAATACQGTSQPSASGSPEASAPTSSVVPSAVPSASAVAGPSSPEEAAELVIASDPRFAGFGPQNPDLIGQCCWYEVTQKVDGYQVLIHAGWGDCPSGCIEKHEWTFDVSPSGEVTLVEESGDPVPADGIPGDGA